MDGGFIQQTRISRVENPDCGFPDIINYKYCASIYRPSCDYNNIPLFEKKTNASDERKETRFSR